jgi:hypothetical protein
MLEGKLCVEQKLYPGFVNEFLSELVQEDFVPRLDFEVFAECQIGIDAVPDLLDRLGDRLFLYFFVADSNGLIVLRKYF